MPLRKKLRYESELLDCCLRMLSDETLIDRALKITIVTGGSVSKDLRVTH